ncbi:MAG: DUF6110 family protein [Clostridium sp.]|uniref:DUF6110 family protein n=2 Tax=Clostridia TaxID=186801 RepID=UPI0009D720AD|nr:hypothetical protein [Clostridium sp.]
MFMDSLKLKNLALFAGGVLFGTAGVKILSSKDVKKVYVEGTAAVLRARDCVMKTAETVQENAEDILAEAKQINERRAAEEAASVQEDTVEDHADPETEEA